MVYKKVLYFYLVFLFVGDRDLKTKEKHFMKNGWCYFELVSFKLLNSYLPFSSGKKP